MPAAARPSNRSRRCHHFQTENTRPTSASAYSTKPGSNVISAGQPSDERGTEWAAPQMRDCAGPISRLRTGGEKKLISAVAGPVLPTLKYGRAVGAPTPAGVDRA